MAEPQLVFVYNAGSDLFSSVSDFAHKILSPSTYQCSLCALTFGSFSMKNEWKNYIESLPVETVFLHKDEFMKQYGLRLELPAAFIKSGEGLQQILTQNDIDHCTSLLQLKDTISSKLKAYDQHRYSNL